jgi:hypothetical protein
LAHSGRFATKVSPEIEYGVGFFQKLGMIATRRPKKVKMSGWFYLTDANAKATLVIEFKRLTTNTSLLWEGVKLTDQIKAYKTWTYLEHTVTLPETVQFSDQCQLFLWRSDATTPVYADDLELRAVE